MQMQGCLAIAPALAQFKDALNEAIDSYEINTPTRLAAFLAQCAHESTLFTRLEENLNYGAPALETMFHNHFTPEEAIQYARKPEKIANRLYANRMGNRDEASGDGWKFRARGVIGITGEHEYEICSLSLYNDLRLLTNPELLTTPDGAMLSAAWYWRTNGLNELADLNTAAAFGVITKRVNGGNNGAAQRLALWSKFKTALNIK